MDAKLLRLTETWIDLQKLNNYLPEYIDLRYTNGYVVRWPKKQLNPADIEMSDNTGNING